MPMTLYVRTVVTSEGPTFTLPPESTVNSEASEPVKLQLIPMAGGDPGLNITLYCPMVVPALPACATNVLLLRLTAVIVCAGDPPPVGASPPRRRISPAAAGLAVEAKPPATTALRVTRRRFIKGPEGN